MKFSVFSLIIGILFANLSNSVCKESEGEKRLKKLLEKSDDGGKVMNFDLSDYKRYNQRFPRPYGLIILLTARDPGYHCSTCLSLERKLEDIAMTYKDTRSKFPDAEPLFFAVIDVDNAREVFSMNQIQYVPIITYQPIELNKDGTDGLTNMKTSDFSTAQLLDYINEHHNIEIPRPLETRKGVLLSGGIAIVFAAIGTFLANNFEAVKTLPWNRNIWMMVSLAVYVSGTGGMIYCIINKSETHAYQGPGRYMFLHSQSRSQFVLEGAIIGAIYIMIAFAVILMYRNTTRYCEADDNPGTLKKGIRKLGTVMRLSVFLSIFIYFFMMLLATYNQKNGWYSLWNLLPDEIKYYMEGSIKGNSFASWTRRICRVLHHYLFDFSTWNFFKAKAFRLLKLRQFFS